MDNDAGFQAIAGRNNAGTKYKVYPVIAPAREVAPYSAVRQISHVGQLCSIGRATSFDDVYAVASYHKNYEQCIEIDNAVVDALAEKSGTFNGVVFDQIRHQNSFDTDYEEERELYVRISTFTAVVHEDTAT